jgi:hypothetical protein
MTFLITGISARPQLLLPFASFVHCASCGFMREPGKRATVKL